MAKNQNTEATTEGTQTEAAPVTPPDVSNTDQRSIVLTVNGVSIKRVDYIRQRWAQKASRSLIAKELSEIQGKKVPYQVVFQATKGLPGGPDKEAAPAEGQATEAASAE